ncbi:MAG: hypothetical protein A4E28_00126 [Methanocella sp. PtaU1.Bin125]|nr:MAG: hypothetical protein A4E28_00126 [Methanocella sp. PtaU1.Bin125]
MPGKDGTGPEGRGPRGRRMGPCRNAAPATTGIVEEQQAEQQAENRETVVPGEPGQATAPVAFGAGRGGRPRGCGMGYCGGRQRR